MSEKEIIGYNFGDGYHADLENHRVFFRGRDLNIRGKHLELLQFFLERPGRPIDRWRGRPRPVGKSKERAPMDNYICELQRLLGTKRGTFFKSEREIGYTLQCIVQPIFRTDRSEAEALSQIAKVHFNEHTTFSMKSALEQSLKGLESPDIRTHAKLHITAAWNLLNLGTVAYSGMLPSVAMPEAKRHAEAALADNSCSAVALGLLGLIAFIFEFDWDTAESYLKKALEREPQEKSSLHSYANLLISRGDFQAGLECALRAVAIDETDKVIYATLGWFYFLAGDHKKAEELTKEAIFRFPEFPPAHFVRGLVLEQNDNYREALESYKQSLKLEPLPITISAIGHLEGMYGNQAGARASLRQIGDLQKTGQIEYRPAYCDALIYASLGDKEQALSALERAYDQKCDWLIHLAVEPRWNEIRNDVRFQRLMKKVNINLKDPKRR